MAERMVEGTVTFVKPFTLPSIGAARPAGTYRISFSEEQIEGLSFAAYRRVATILYLPAVSIPGPREMLVVDQAEIDAALTEDSDL